MFFHDPFGSSDAQSLYNYKQEGSESNYMYFFDQEPIHLDLHGHTFDEVVRRNTDICWPYTTPGSIVTSEQNSQPVMEVCDRYGWKSHYYFFHGWAALDWYRGYDRTFLISSPEDRNITKSFISANRIVGGKRDHRTILMYHLLKHKVHNAHISFPRVCPVEGVSVSDIARRWHHIYPDITKIFESCDLPWNFRGENLHPMHSCWLSLFEQCAETCLYVITETVQQGKRYHLTEKTFKPICLQMPFVLVSTQGSLDYLKTYGFKTFAEIWDETYDHEADDILRLAKVAALLKSFDDMSSAELTQIYRATLPIIQHNHRHFYGGDFEQKLWQEMLQMLQDIQRDVTHS